ncbi:MAG: DUF975 family protein [Bacteroidales bacterium]|nr:DUF975 family protein [Bacteroidales bacterium]
MKNYKEYRDLAAKTLSGRMASIVIATLALSVMDLLLGTYTNISTNPSIGRLVPGVGFALSNFAWMSIFGIIGFLVLMPVRYSYETAFLNVVRDKGVKDLTTRMFSCFNTKEYGRAIEVPLLVSVYTILWMLLFIIPGIVKAYSYAMAIYISKDKPELSAEECIQESRRMMSGYKGKLFLLDLSYIGWVLLCILTCGILSLWVAPKMETAHVLFYEDLKSEVNAHTEQ